MVLVRVSEAIELADHSFIGEGLRVSKTIELGAHGINGEGIKSY